MLHLSASGITHHLNGQEKTWTIQELLEIPDPLSGLPLAERNAAMKQVVDLATELFDELSETARLQHDFWKQLKPERISTLHFTYHTKVIDTYQWELSLNPEGLFYRDLIGEYSAAPGKVTEQLLSDFWFYGPCLPVPDLHTRKMLVAAIRNAFLQAGSPASYRHFQLFEYPFPEGFLKQWVEGDEKAKDFVIVRHYGIEAGRQTWYDGLVYLNYIAFEQFLHQPARRYEHLIGAQIQTELKEMLSPVIRLQEPFANPKSIQQQIDERKAESKRLFMDNGGQTHYIYLDGDGPNYYASPEDEAAWRKELLDGYAKRIQEEDNGAALAYLARSMKFNGADNVIQILTTAAQNAPKKTKLGIAQALQEVFNHDLAAELLSALLEEAAAESKPWQTIVFKEFSKMRHNKGAQKFIIACLLGDNENYFHKAVDTVKAWGADGDKALSDWALHKYLNWEDATANDPDFRKALEKIINLIQKK